MKKNLLKVTFLIALSSALSFTAFAEEEATAPSTSQIGENANVNCMSENTSVAKGDEVQAPIHTDGPSDSQSSTGLGTDKK